MELEGGKEYGSEVSESEVDAEPKGVMVDEDETKGDGVILAEVF